LQNGVEEKVTKVFEFVCLTSNGSPYTWNLQVWHLMCLACTWDLHLAPALELTPQLDMKSEKNNLMRFVIGYLSSQVCSTHLLAVIDDGKAREPTFAKKKDWNMSAP
jgi:hypothetical protein